MEPIEDKPLTLSRQEIIEMIREMMTNHDCLNPQLFDKDKKLHTIVRKKLLEIADFVKEEFYSCFTLLDISDVNIAGSSCSHIYNDQTDIDMFLETDVSCMGKPFLTQPALNGITGAITRIPFKPTLYGRAIDFGVWYDKAGMNDYSCYSLTRDCWLQAPPVHQEFEFTPEELFDMYVAYNEKLHRFVASLEKDDEGFLVEDSRRKLFQHLSDIHIRAVESKWFSEKHEYSAEYNIFRLLKKFNVTKHFRRLIRESERRHVNKKKIPIDSVLVSDAK